MSKYYKHKMLAACRTVYKTLVPILYNIHATFISIVERVPIIYYILVS